MYALQNMQLLFLLTYALSCLCEDAEKPHFQIDHKSGKIYINATKETADISSTGDMVDVLMKPGGSRETNDKDANVRHNTDAMDNSHQKTTETKDGVKTGENTAPSNNNDEDNEPSRIVGFDNNWKNLFQLPKSNHTIKAKLYDKNPATKGDSNEESEENQKLLALEKEAANLARTILSYSKDEGEMLTIKEAASKLEDKVGELNSTLADTLKKFDSNKQDRQANDSNVDIPMKEERTSQNGSSRENNENNGADSGTNNEPQRQNDENRPQGDNDENGSQGEKTGNKDNADSKEGESNLKKPKGTKSCPNCSVNIPKAGQKQDSANDTLVPKLSDGNKADSSLQDAQNDTVSSKNKSMSEESKYTSDNSTSSQKLDESQEVTLKSKSEIKPYERQNESIDLDDADQQVDEALGRSKMNFHDNKQQNSTNNDIIHQTTASNDGPSTNRTSNETADISDLSAVDSKLLEQGAKVKDFEKVLEQFLQSSDPKDKEELLKMTWHDLKMKKSHDGDPNGETVRLKTEQEMKSNVTIAPESEHTTEKNKQKDSLKQIVGRLKDKISLLKEFIEYREGKKIMKNERKGLNPYANIRRHRITSKFDWLNAKLLKGRKKL